MKKIFILLLVAGTLLSGCTKKTEEIEIVNVIDIQGAMQSLSKVANYPSQAWIDEQYFVTQFNLDDSLGIAATGVFGNILDANRIVLFHADTKDKQTITLQCLEQFKEDLTSRFVDDPELYEQIDQAVILQNGNYIIFISGLHLQEISDQFQELF